MIDSSGRTRISSSDNNEPYNLEELINNTADVKAALQNLFGGKFPDNSMFGNAIQAGMQNYDSRNRLTSEDITKLIQEISYSIGRINSEYGLQAIEYIGKNTFVDEVWGKNERVRIKRRREIFHNGEYYGKHAEIDVKGNVHVAIVSPNFRNPDGEKKSADEALIFMSDWILVEDVHNLSEDEKDRMVSSMQMRNNKA